MKIDVDIELFEVLKWAFLFGAGIDHIKERIKFKQIKTANWENFKSILENSSTRKWSKTTRKKFANFAAEMLQTLEKDKVISMPETSQKFLKNLLRVPTM